MISSDLIERCFYNIDRLWFQGLIEKEIINTRHVINFKANEKLTSVAGRFGQQDGRLEIQMSKQILDNLFNDKIKRVEIGGIICSSLLKVFVIIMEHEITHLIIYLLKENPYIKSIKKQHHSKAFKVFVYNMYHQLTVTHNLLFGDIDKYRQETKKAIETFDIGDIVKCNLSSFEGTLVTMTKQIGVIKINGKYKACLLRDLILIKKTEQKNIMKLLKDGIKIGDTRDIELNNKIVNVKIIDKGNATFKVKLTETGKIYSVKYWILVN